MRISGAIAILAFTAGPALAAEPDGLALPPGFHAIVVADGVGPVRHLAVRDNGDIYLSTGRGKLGAGTGIIALHQDANHHADQTQRFGAANGTGIRFHDGALYAADTAKVYRFDFHGNELVPSAEPTVVVDNMSESRAANHAIALDNKGNLYVSVDGMANLCTAPGAPANAPPVGLRPCPDLGVRAGIWRFSAGKSNQDFAKGELVATGIRDLNAMDIAGDGTVYGFMHGRDTTSKQFPAIVTDADEANIADELHVVTKGADFGWPYTYYDGVRKIRLVAPEYGGDGKTAATGNYATPVFTLQAARPAPLDMVFYQGRNFPASYRGGSFVVLHGAGGGEAIQGGKTGDDVIFVPRAAGGKFGAPMAFAGGFAGSSQPGPNGRITPQYRVTGAAVGPDGALYVADGNKGRVWRIAYGE